MVPIQTEPIRRSGDETRLDTTGAFLASKTPPPQGDRNDLCDLHRVSQQRLGDPDRCRERQEGHDFAARPYRSPAVSDRGWRDPILEKARSRGSDRDAEVLDASTSLGIPVLCLPGIPSALCRRQREGTLAARHHRTLKENLFEDIGDADIVQLSPAVLQGSLELLEAHVLRAMDALHVSSALQWKADLFVSADKRQLDAAAESGLKVARL